MNLRKLTWGSILCLACFAGGIAVAQGGMWRGHPNLAAAEQATHQADQYLLAAQHANHWDLAGHAAHAEQLLRQADREIRAAAMAANHR